MNNQELGIVIQRCAVVMHEDHSGYWKFEYGGDLVFVLTDESHNRMRAMTAVSDLKSIRADQWPILMAANYDRALDARYCIKDDMLWSAFIHPLNELGDSQFLDALEQVVMLAKNYGSSYASSDLIFAG